jgi:IS5 family transposase
VLRSGTGAFFSFVRRATPADGADKLKALLPESLAVATRTDAMKPSDLARVVIDTTVQPKAVMFPTDAKLLNRARERLV